MKKDMATKEKTGIVVSTSMEKTIVIAVENRYAHPIYGKTIKKTQRFMAHDENSFCKLGDKVIIIETRPLSRKKRWTLKQNLTQSGT
uniref:Small ribosomal subunit protein uS17c n=1 Tax=Rhizochromulina marina TaxID=1034831 RepID=A0A514CPV9_9STRA|nr:ribosomal protein S17 [Rhizochromulina marina]QDH81832.1 ribosomal protein S17 [Rhizochromulina marina]